MKQVVLVAALALGACFSKPGFSGDGGSGGDDGGSDGSVPSDGLARLAAGHHHACAIDEKTQLWCWGDNSHGELGDTGLARTGNPVLAFQAMADGWTSVVAGEWHTCGLHAGDTYCWGDDSFLEAGGSNPPNKITLTSPAVRLFAGHHASCALDATGALTCWGQIDANANPAFTPPTQIAPGGIATGWLDVALGPTHSCAVGEMGRTACWGRANNRQLGDTNGTRLIAGATPLTESSAVRTFAQVATTEGVTCGVTLDHHLLCYGSPSTGLLSESMLSQDTEVPVMVGVMQSWSRITLGFSHACGIATTGMGAPTVYCYGDNAVGAMGDGFAPHHQVRPVTLPMDFGTPTELVAGFEFACARNAAGKVMCWGANGYGENGAGPPASTSTAVQVALGVGTGDTILAITAGNAHSCALIDPAGPTPNIVKCWGDNTKRQVDGATGGFRETPTEATTDLVSISAGENHTCGLTPTGTVKCWGSNSNWQLGRMGGNGIFTPAGNYVQIAAGSTGTCAVTDSPSFDLECWGSTPGGNDLSSPTKVNTEADAWTSIAVGSGFAAGAAGIGSALKGFGEGCAFADTTVRPPSMPTSMNVSISGATTLVAAQSQGGHICLLDTSGLRCWGSNKGKQISPTAVECTGPSDAGPLTAGMAWAAPGVGKLGAANDHTCAIVDVAAGDGRVYCWGGNPGYLGFSLSNPGVPQLASSIIATQLATGPRHICAIGKQSASQPGEQVYCWGENRAGEVGNGSRFHDTPIAVLIP